MKELILNEDKLKDKEIDDYVTRVKAIIVNDKKELLLGFSYNDYQFPGGHLEKEEEPVKGLIRELKEEKPGGFLKVQKHGIQFINWHFL